MSNTVYSVAMGAVICLSMWAGLIVGFAIFGG